MRGKIKHVCLLFLIIICAFAFSGCMPGCILENTEGLFENAEVTVVEEAKLSVSYNVATRDYDVRVEGILKNTEEYNVSISITIILYDADGNALTSIDDYISQIEGNGSWHYCARATTNIKPASCRVITMDAYKY